MCLIFKLDELQEVVLHFVLLCVDLGLEVSDLLLAQLVVLAYIGCQLEVLF